MTDEGDITDEEWQQALDVGNYQPKFIESELKAKEDKQKKEKKSLYRSIDDDWQTLEDVEEKTNSFIRKIYPLKPLVENTAIVDQSKVQPKMPKSEEEPEPIKPPLSRR